MLSANICETEVRVATSTNWRCGCFFLDVRNTIPNLETCVGIWLWTNGGCFCSCRRASISVWLSWLRQNVYQKWRTNSSQEDPYWTSTLCLSIMRKKIWSQGSFEKTRQNSSETATGCHTTSVLLLVRRSWTSAWLHFLMDVKEVVFSRMHTCENCLLEEFLKSNDNIWKMYNLPVVH